MKKLNYLLSLAVVFFLLVVPQRMKSPNWWRKTSPSKLKWREIIPITR